MTITLTPEAEQTLTQEAIRENKSLEQMAVEAMLAGLRHQRVPQSLDELSPRRLLPTGITLKDAMEETPWPHDEPDVTDEEIRRALETLR
jgi:hypothetical protein